MKQQTTQRLIAAGFGVTSSSLAYYYGRTIWKTSGFKDQASQQISKIEYISSYIDDCINQKETLTREQVSKLSGMTSELAKSPPDSVDTRLQLERLLKETKIYSQLYTQKEDESNYVKTMLVETKDSFDHLSKDISHLKSNANIGYFIGSVGFLLLGALAVNRFYRAIFPKKD